jgi:hypothetical protein
LTFKGHIHVQNDRFNNFLLSSLALVISFPAWASDLPDPVLTPGAINPNVTQANIQQTVCVKGYTKTIRPPAHFTNKLKKRQIREYGYADRNPKHYEEDHLIALSIAQRARVNTRLPVSSSRTTGTVWVGAILKRGLKSNSPIAAVSGHVAAIP